LCSSGRLVTEPPVGEHCVPNCAVTVRITNSGEDIVDYLTYISDADGFLSAARPVPAITTETGRDVTVTDHPRPCR
jgi:hypothetical protein